MKCEKCGNNLIGENNFCLRCGYNNQKFNIEKSMKVEKDIIENRENGNKKEKNKILKMLLVVGFVLILSGGLVSFFNYKKENTAEFYSKTKDLCNGFEGGIKDVIIDKYASYILTDKGSVFYYYISKEDKLLCTRIKELINVKAIDNNPGGLYIETFNGEKNLYSILTGWENYILQKESIKYKNPLQQDFIDFYIIGSKTYYIKKDNSIYELSIKQEYKKIIDGMVFDEMIENFYVTDSYNPDIIVKTRNYIYKFDENKALIGKYKKIKQFKSTQIKLLINDFPGELHYIVTENGDIYKDNLIFEENLKKKTKVPLTKNQKNELIAPIVVALVLFSLIICFSYIGRNKTFGQTYKKLFVFQCIGFVVFSILDGLTLKELIKGMIALPVMPFIIDSIYTINKKLSWYFMNLSKTKNIIIFIIYNVILYFLTNITFLNLLKLFGVKIR